MPPKQSTKRKRTAAAEPANNNNNNVTEEPMAKLRKEMVKEFGEDTVQEVEKAAKKAKGSGLTGVHGFLNSIEEASKTLSTSSNIKVKQVGDAFKEILEALKPRKISVSITGDQITFTPPIDKISISDFLKVSETVLTGASAVKTLDKLTA